MRKRKWTTRCDFVGPGLVRGRRDGRCPKSATCKVPFFGQMEPFCICDEHAEDWRRDQPHNVKSLDDDTPWENKETNFFLSSIVPEKRRRYQPGREPC